MSQRTRRVTPMDRHKLTMKMDQGIFHRWRISEYVWEKQKEGRIRLCVDNCELNNITKKQRYLLPLIGEARDRLQDAQYFTKLDIKDAYPNVKIREGDQRKTTFSTKLGTYKYLVMPFTLCKAPTAFQR